MTFLPNPLLDVELERELISSGAMKEPAEQIASTARDIAPVDTGEYQASIHVESDSSGTAVVAGTDHGVWVEWGTEDTPAFHVLTRAAETDGFEVGGHK